MGGARLRFLEKRYLFTPGPTPVPPAVLAAGAEPIVHHRGPDFRDVYASTLGRLKEVCRTSADVLLFTASGTGAMESAVANLCAPGDRVAVVSHGSFGERWIAICEQHGLDVQALRYEWGEVPDADEVGAAVRESGVDLVFCQQSDTSTGVVSDVRAVKEAVGDALLVVDAISSLGAVPLETDAWGIDVVVSGSQKALMCPPGLALASVPPHVLERVKPSRSFYFDWRRNKKAQDALDAAFTPAVSLIRSLDVALGLILADTLEACFERHVATRSGRARRREGDGARALLTGRRHRCCGHRDPGARGDRQRRAAAPSSRPARCHARARPAAPQGEDLPDRAHRLVRRLRHRDRARGRRALADRAGRRHRARRCGATCVRGVREPRHRLIMRVLVREKIADAGIDLLREHFEVDVDTESPLDEIIDGYEGLIVRSATKVTADLIARATSLKVVGRAGVGVDNVDVDAATRRGIVVANAPESNIVSAAEHTIGLLLALARNIPQAHAALTAGRWERSKWGGVELADKTLGVLGFGRIGRQVARRAVGLQMKVVAYDPFVSAERFRELGVDSASFEEVLARADFLTLHLPLTDDTRSAIDAAAIAQMRDGVRIVNAARGELVDEAALIAALESGKVAGAAIDVYRRGAVRRSAAAGAERRRDAASRSVHRRGAGPRRRDRRRAGGGRARRRPRHERCQHPDRRRRRPRGARAVRATGREARPPGA